MFVSLVPDGRDAMEHPGELTLAVLSSMSGDPLSKAGSKTHIPKTHPGCWETILQIHPFNPWCPERFLCSPASEQSLESLPSRLVALSGDFFTTTKCAKGHLSVCCRPLAAVITTEQCPAVS